VVLGAAIQRRQERCLQVGHVLIHLSSDPRVVWRLLGHYIGKETSRTWHAVASVQFDKAIKIRLYCAKPIIVLSQQRQGGLDVAFPVRAKTAQEEILFAAKIGIDTASTHARRFHQIGHRSGSKALAPKHAHRTDDQVITLF
jgi:hypothetical protein